LSGLFFMKKVKTFILTKSVGLYINFLSYVNPRKAMLLAYQLFSQPRIGKLSKDNLPKFLQSSTTETHHHNDKNFQTYTWKGNDNVILLLHGWESNASRWKKLLPYLKKTGSTIIAIDAPAHGMSSGKEFNVPQYAEYIDVLIQKHQPKHIIGHSLGGIAIAYYQHHYKNNEIEKIVLLGAPSDFKIILNNYKKLLSLNSKVHQSLVAYTKERFNIIVDDFSTSNFLKNATLEGIIAHDIHDKVVAYTESEKINTNWKKGTLITTEGFGHSLHNTELYEKIAAFLKNK
jgi:pimeloyl-ACP methyl ester carboxylesterase